MEHGQPKKNQLLTGEELKHVLAVARGDRIADRLFRNVQIIDLINGGSYLSHVALSGHWIAGIGLDYEEGHEIVEAKGLTMVPGFIDGHVHLESSLMHPFEFEAATLPLGTTTAICDPHEITNVLGDKGFSWFLRSAQLMHQNLYVQVSSCIPSLPGFETQGGNFELEQMKSYRGHPCVLGLAEMMNFPGVINGDDEVLAKLEAFSSWNLHLDGHCPLLRGKKLNAYVAAGIQNCHETVSHDEGLEKLQRGLSLILREGSVAKNLITLAPLVKEFNSHQCFLCTDDRNPHEIAQEGHINYLVWKLINEARLPLHLAYKTSSYSAAKHFGLRRMGLIAPGHRADLILLSDPQQVKIEDVYIGGRRVQDMQLDRPSLLEQKMQESLPPLENTMRRRPLQGNEISFSLTPGRYHCIEIIPNEIITRHLQVNFDGRQFDQPDVLKMAVIERYGQQRPPALGLVKGMGLSQGALASSVAHDAHNIIVIGTHEEDMVLAVNTLIKEGGGFTVVTNGVIKEVLPLPIAGLMSLQPASWIAEKMENLHQELEKLNVALTGPFLQMAFLALPVIPSLKLTDRGLVDVENFQFIDLKVEPGNGHRGNHDYGASS